MIYLELFWSFFQVGLFSFGGGYAALPLIQQQAVALKGWITLTEFTDIITIAEMTPGPVALNSATFVGTRLAGIAGAVAATTGCVAPSCIIVTLLAVLYNKYKNLEVIQSVLSALRPAVAAFIAFAGISILFLSVFGEGGIFGGNINYISAGIFICSLFIIKKFKTSPVLIMLASGAAGIIIYCFIM